MSRLSFEGQCPYLKIQILLGLEFAYEDVSNFSQNSFIVVPAIHNALPFPINLLPHMK